MVHRPAARRARAIDYSNIGRAGRRTGVTVGELQRDEHGLEVIDGLFSSPQKSPAKNNGLSLNSTTPKPTDALSTRKSVGGAVQLPPRSRSPIKTSLTGTARRTPLSRASIRQESEETPTRASPRLNTARRMSFTSQETPPSLRRAPLQEMRGNSASPNRANSVQKIKSPALKENDNSGVANFSDDDEVYGNGNAHGVIPTKIRQSIETAQNGFDDSYLLPNGDDSVQDVVMRNVDAILEEEVATAAPEAEEQEEDIERQEVEIQSDAESDDYQIEEEQVASSPAPEPPKKGRKRKSDEIEPIAIATKRSKGKQRAASPPEDVEMPMRPNNKGKGKAKGKQAKIPDSVFQDPPADRASDGETLAPQPAQKKKRAPKLKDPNLQMNPRQVSELSNVVKRHTSRNPSSKTRSLYILKRETPFDDTTTHTRSGRVSIKPVAYWRNERCVYGESEVEAGQRFPMATIKEVVRTEEVVEPAQNKRKPRKKGKNKAGKSQSPSSDAGNDGSEADDGLGSDADPWESSPGILHALVRRWDDERQVGLHEAEEIDLAYSAPAIQTKEVHGSHFKYAKLTSSPFFGSGVVDLPPGGLKKPKNSRRFQMVFYVFSGRVRVQVAGTEFGVGKGGMWQVPRGNQYQIENPYKKDARIFFAQGCEIVPEVPVDEDAGGQSSRR